MCPAFGVHYKGITDVTKADNVFSISRKHLKDRRAYSEEVIELAIFSNTRSNFSVKGGGEDWAVRFVDGQQDKLPLGASVLLSIMIAITALTVGLNYFAEASPSFNSHGGDEETKPRPRLRVTTETL